MPAQACRPFSTSIGRQSPSQLASRTNSPRFGGLCVKVRTPFSCSSAEVLLPCLPLSGVALPIASSAWCNSVGSSGTRSRTRAGRLACFSLDASRWPEAPTMDPGFSGNEGLLSELPCGDFTEMYLFLRCQHGDHIAWLGYDDTARGLTSMNLFGNVVTESWVRTCSCLFPNTLANSCSILYSTAVHSPQNEGACAALWIENKPVLAAPRARRSMQALWQKSALHTAAATADDTY